MFILGHFLMTFVFSRTHTDLHQNPFSYHSLSTPPPLSRHSTPLSYDRTFYHATLFFSFLVGLDHELT
jgi:hypothetical protein